MQLEFYGEGAVVGLLVSMLGAVVFFECKCVFRGFFFLNNWPGFEMSRHVVMYRCW